MSDDFTATLPRKRMAAGVLLSDGRDRVLLVEPTYKAHWEIPGGTVEAGESPHAAAVREIEEELGLPVRPGRLLVTDWVPPRPERTEGLMLVFDGGVLAPEQAALIRLPAAELRGWAWCTEREAGERLPELLARRLAAAVSARDRGTAAYLENGFHLEEQPC
ncbi:NUDIX domain-containing protein [Actinoplanes sp. NPDC049668]|uniref:NUDIX hydrolase n=1 Tax=unclassified Actinoplanes TaxID=2626549 RepID=UPI0033A525AD